ncbi:tyrosine-type recombinase/integrase [Sphingomonas immobilis]|uniref:Tyrosine-type recombinase/integrase n=1 Tax=Sphingomonas immobilis TaxID=3063997 RepID=A0ABT8ZVT2_9SPHN|nr:tyrosine-type recombinase/integrase [Sphingomonas sp. CA1-15]MDO7841115.1 tyrosine-type recombinase/integrase [Sphingomonas sp. CA1-15]
MAKVTLPRYLRARRGADGKTRYYWQRPNWAAPPNERWGRLFKVDSEALGTDLAEAISKAELLNVHLDEWRRGVTVAPDSGTIKALFNWYRQRDRYKELREISKADYRKYMPVLEAFKLKSTLLGDRQAADITSDHADAIYRQLAKDRGKRAASHCMQICRRVFYEAVRAKKLKHNPFARMGLKMVAETGNRATSREEYDRFREQARKSGYQSMATAAAIAFELVRRTTDVFGYILEDGDELRGFFWEDYAPGITFAMRQGKTGTRQVIPLRGDPEPDSEDAEIRERGRLLYPALEEELARHAPGGKGQIVVSEASGDRYTKDAMRHVFEAIREKAGLPKEMTFTGFRHGGATELGDVGIEDIRPISGHKTLGQTTVYNKVTEKKARRIGEVRRAGVEGRK